MIFKDSMAYMVKNETRNNTNTKNYNLLNNNFVFEVTFKPNLHNKEEYESCVLGRTGYCMGIFTHSFSDNQSKHKYSTPTIKWVWFRKDENQNLVYDSIIFNSSDPSKKYFDRWWRKWIKKNSPIKLEKQLEDSLFRKWAWLDDTTPHILNSKSPSKEIIDTLEMEDIQNSELRNWISKIDDFKIKTASLVTEIIKVKVIKKNNKFMMYINDIHFMTKNTGELFDYSDQTIFVGAGNPLIPGIDPSYFNGEIFEVKIYHEDDEDLKNLYLWFDFKKNSQFKTFDKSGNGNHGQIYETNENISKINQEFNQYARPPKI